jgi:hypothetical protein
LIFVRRRFWVTAQDRVFTAVFFQFARLTLVFGVASAPPESLCAGRSFFLWSCGVLRCICRLCYSPHARPSFCGRPSFSLPGPHPGSLLYFIWVRSRGADFSSPRFSAPHSLSQFRAPTILVHSIVCARSAPLGVLPRFFNSSQTTAISALISISRFDSS